VEFLAYWVSPRSFGDELKSADFLHLAVWLSHVATPAHAWPIALDYLKKCAKYLLS